DMAYAVRQILGDLEVTAEGVCGMLLHATGKKPAEREMAQINALATLNELNHYSNPDSVYPGDAEHGLRPCGPGQRPFDDCYFMALGDQMDRSEAEAASDRVAEYLALDAAGNSGPVFEQFRRQSRQPNGLSLRTFGLQRLGSTREYLGERAAGALCRQVVALWTGGLSVDESKAIDSQAERLATSQALDAEALLKRFEAAAIAFSGGDPLARLEPALVRSLEEFQVAPEGSMNMGATKNVL